MPGFPECNHREQNVSHWEQSALHREQSVSHWEQSVSHWEQSVSHWEQSVLHRERSVSHWEQSAEVSDGSILSPLNLHGWCVGWYEGGSPIPQGRVSQATSLQPGETSQSPPPRPDLVAEGRRPE